MKKLAALFLSLLLLPFGSLGATITGSIADSTLTGILQGIEVDFQADGPWLNGPQIVMPRTVRTSTDAKGNWSISLAQGTYKVTVGGTPIGFIRVPLDSGTYTIDQVNGTIVMLGNGATFGQTKIDINDGVPGFIDQKFSTGPYVGIAYSQVVGNGVTNFIASFYPMQWPANLITGFLTANQISPPGSDSQILLNLQGAFAANTNLYFSAETLYTPAIVCTNLTVLGGGSAAPVNATDPGLPGDFSWDSSYFYLCVDTNTWKRALLSTWP